MKTLNASSGWLTICSLVGMSAAVACGSHQSPRNSMAPTDAAPSSNGRASDLEAGLGSDTSTAPSNTEPSGDGTVDAGTEGSASASDGPSAADDTGGTSCSTGGTSTASQPGYLGDWMPGDYPPDLSKGNYLTISGVSGQMGNTRQYGVHVPTGYRSDTPVPALF